MCESYQNSWWYSEEENCSFRIIFTQRSWYNGSKTNARKIATKSVKRMKEMASDTWLKKSPWKWLDFYDFSVFKIQGLYSILKYVEVKKSYITIRQLVATDPLVRKKLKMNLSTYRIPSIFKYLNRNVVQQVYDVIIDVRKNS